jgi:hypothetical protein
MNEYIFVEGTMSEGNSCLSCLLWPFVALWRLTTLVFELTGRLVAIVLGVVLMILGVIVCLTVVGAVVGVPLILCGLLLVARGLF